MIYPLVANGTVVTLDPERRVIEKGAVAVSRARLGLRHMLETPRDLLDESARLKRRQSPMAAVCARR